MLEKKNTKPLKEQHVLTPEQRVALIESKVRRAELHIAAIKKLAGKMQKR
jgi:hypothetical protein